MIAARRPPPESLAELLLRAEALAGHTLGEVAAALGCRGGRYDAKLAATNGLHAKGLAGDLVERALGATAGSAAAPDFPALGVELKTVPLDAGGHVSESTFVCTLPLAEAADASWSTSWLRRKLARVLWVPVEAAGSGVQAGRRLGRPILWRPSPAEEALLRDDFEELVGRLGSGAIDDVDGYAGACLQVRPKASDGRARTLAFGAGGEAIEAPPRGFYLRARFTEALLRASVTAASADRPERAPPGTKAR